MEIIKHDIKKLPLWVYQMIKRQEDYIKQLEDKLEDTQNLNAVMSEPKRDWFTLPNPIGGCGEDNLHLWILDKDHPFTLCVLNKGDLLFIGRTKREG